MLHMSVGESYLEQAFVLSVAVHNVVVEVYASICLFLIHIYIRLLKCQP